MGSRYEVEVTVRSARDLKNVNWRHGELKPYAVLWIDEDGAKCSTRVASGENPDWEDDGDKVLVPLPASSSLSDAVLYIDVVHAAAAGGDEDVKKPLVGSARLPLRDVVDDAGIGGGKASRTLRLKRPSGRPQGRLDVRVAVRERYHANPYPSPYGSRDAYYGQPTAAAPGGYGYGYGGAAPPQQAYGSPATAAVDPSQQKDKTGGGGKMGMGTGLAVGAAAGVLGGLALAGGASYLENKFEDSVAERVDDQLAARDDDDDDY